VPEEENKTVYPVFVLPPRSPKFVMRRGHRGYTEEFYDVTDSFLKEFLKISNKIDKLIPSE
jgi:hypothetical protein